MSKKINEEVDPKTVETITVATETTQVAVNANETAEQSKEPKKANKKPAVKKKSVKSAIVKVEDAKTIKGKKPSKKIAVVNKKEKPTKTIKKKEKRTADNFNRSFNRIRFSGNDYPKTRLVLAVIKKHVEDNPKTKFADLEKAFPQDLLRNWGVFREVNSARRTSKNGKTRYHLNTEDIITLADGKRVAVASQWSEENIKPFLKTARALGYTMTANKQ